MLCPERQHHVMLARYSGDILTEWKHSEYNPGQMLSKQIKPDQLFRCFSSSLRYMINGLKCLSFARCFYAFDVFHVKHFEMPSRVYILVLYLKVRLVVNCCLKVMLKAVHWLFPNFAFMWLVEEAKKNLPLELDFLNEGHNAEKVANMLAHFSFLKVHTITVQASLQGLLVK